MPSGSGDGRSGTGQGLPPKTERRVAKRIKYIFSQTCFLKNVGSYVLLMSKNSSYCNIFIAMRVLQECFVDLYSMVNVATATEVLFSPANRRCVFSSFSRLPRRETSSLHKADGTTVAQKDFDGGGTQKVSDGGGTPLGLISEEIHPWIVGGESPK